MPYGLILLVRALVGGVRGAAADFAWPVDDRFDLEAVRLRCLARMLTDLRSV